MAKHIQADSEKVVIVAGPTFCEALKFVLFGAILGGGAVYVLLSREKEGFTSPNSGDAVTEGLTAGGAKPSGDASAISRILSVAKRAKVVTDRARDAVAAAQEIAAPVVKQAVETGKQRAAEVEAKLRKDLDEAGSRPALAEEDEELPSQTEKKFVE